MNEKSLMGSLIKTKIYDYVTSRIRNCVYESGDKLNEDAIAKTLNVSRTPVREVLTNLASNGFIEKIPNKGFYVREYSGKEKLESYEVISYLDYLCAKNAVDNLIDSDFLKMKECIAKMDVAITFHNYHDYIDTQLDFHHIYINKCDNSVLIKTINSLINSPMPTTYSNHKDEDRFFHLLKTSNDEHKELCSILENKDLDSLQQLMTKHWTNCVKEYI